MNVTIEPLLCGTLSCSRSQLETGASADEITIPVPAWLVRHPQGLVLMDCGMHTDLARPSEYLDLVSNFFGVGLSGGELIASALQGVEVDPADIDTVVVSHLHFDHVGGLAQIPNARVLVQREEWAAGADDDLAASNAFMASDYRLGHDVVELDGAHDIFGDGLVSCLPTPGHTPGHQSLCVRLADREVVLCGDCAYFAETLDGGALPPFGHDPAEHAESIRRLQAMRADGAVLIPGHDPALFDALPSRLS